MGSTTVRISATAREHLKALADRENVPMQMVLDKAIEYYRRRAFLEATNEAFRALKRNKRAWQGELKERRAWERTLRDDLHDE